MGVVDEHSKFICRVPIRVGLLLHPGLQSAFKMTRGNQRELARAKNVKKQSDAKKGSSQKDGNKGMTLEARKQRDAEMMRLKQEKGKAKEKPST